MKNFLLILVACLAALGADPAPVGRIVGGPYVVNVSARNATVMWIVQTGSVALSVAGQSAGAIKNSPSFQVEKTTLTGLKANTSYEYNVGGADGSGKGSFKTPPAPPASALPFRFVVYGDNRTRDDVHRRVVETMLKLGAPDFVVQTGDMTPDGFDTSAWPVFFDIERELLRHTAFFPALGNHERHTPVFAEFFDKPKPWYSFDWGNAHFAVIDSDLGSVSPQQSEQTAYWKEETRWLEEDLKAHQAADFRFVAAHHGPITAVASRQGDNPHMTALLPMLEKYRVSAGLFGHDHNYQHYLKNGVHYLISGGGGAPLYDVDKPAAGITQKVMSVENFISFSVNGKVVSVKTYAIDGKVIDEFEMKAPASI
jgi:hypothetical protein